MKRGRPKTGIVLKHSKTVFLTLKRLRARGEGWVNLTILEKYTKLHHAQISRVLDLIKPFIEEIDVKEIFPTNLRLRILRLKDTETTFDRILQYLRINKMVEG